MFAWMTHYMGVYEYVIHYVCMLIKCFPIEIYLKIQHTCQPNISMICLWLQLHAGLFELPMYYILYRLGQLVGEVIRIIWANVWYGSSPYCIALISVWTASIESNNNYRLQTGAVFCLLCWVSSDCAQPITGQVTSVTWPVIGWA